MLLFGNNYLLLSFLWTPPPQSRNGEGISVMTCSNWSKNFWFGTPFRKTLHIVSPALTDETVSCVLCLTIQTKHRLPAWARDKRCCLVPFTESHSLRYSNTRKDCQGLNALPLSARPIRWHARVKWPWASMWRRTHRSTMRESVTLLQLLLACLCHPVMSLTQIPKFCINTPFLPISTPWERGSCRRCGSKCLQGKEDCYGPIRHSRDAGQQWHHSLEPAMDWNMVGTSSDQSRKMCAQGWRDSSAAKET